MEGFCAEFESLLPAGRPLRKPSFWRWGGGQMHLNTGLTSAINVNVHFSEMEKAKVAAGLMTYRLILLSNTIKFISAISLLILRGGFHDLGWIHCETLTKKQKQNHYSLFNKGNCCVTNFVRGYIRRQHVW